MMDKENKSLRDASTETSRVFNPSPESLPPLPDITAVCDWYSSTPAQNRSARCNWQCARAALRGHTETNAAESTSRRRLWEASKGPTRSDRKKLPDPAQLSPAQVDPSEYHSLLRIHDTSIPPCLSYPRPCLRSHGCLRLQNRGTSAVLEQPQLSFRAAESRPSL